MFFKDKIIDEKVNLQLLNYARTKKIKLQEIDEATKKKIRQQIEDKTKTTLKLTERDIKLIHKALQTRGYKIGPDSPTLTKEARKSITNFQSSVGLISTGVMNQETAEAMKLDLQGIETTKAGLVSSSNARSYDVDQLKLIEDDTRLG